MLSREDQLTYLFSLLVTSTLKAMFQFGVSKSLHLWESLSLELDAVTGWGIGSYDRISMALSLCYSGNWEVEFNLSSLNFDLPLTIRIWRKWCSQTLRPGHKKLYRLYLESIHTCKTLTLRALSFLSNPTTLRPPCYKKASRSAEIKGIEISWNWKEIRLNQASRHYAKASGTWRSLPNPAIRQP